MGVRSLLAGLLVAVTVVAQDPIQLPNNANSTVPYDLPQTAKYDYSEVLHKALLFYHAQRSGPLGKNRRLAWRGDTCFICTGPKGEDLSGGYFEAANTMKWGLPLSWTLTQLSFNIYVFGDAMKAVNQLDEARAGVKWGVDYLINCVSDSENFVGQFGVSAIKNGTGEVDIDFGYFGPPEEYEMWVPLGIQRPSGIAYINSTNPSSEILGESAAALAAASVTFASTDKAYSDKVLGLAKDLYTRASTHLGSYMNSTHPNLQTVKVWYPSSIYYDELAWAASWLFAATKDQAYYTQAKDWIVKAYEHGGEYSWDEKLPGAYVVLYMETKNETYKAEIENFMANYYPGGKVKQTAKGLMIDEVWGSLRYAANTAFIMLSYAKSIGYQTANGTRAVTFAAQQLNYMLGDCGRSWVVGFGKDWPLRPYHKSSYNSFIDYPRRGTDNGDQSGDFLESNATNKFILYGALVGGPAWDDTFRDDRSSYEYTDKYHLISFLPLRGLMTVSSWACLQVTQDYNAAFVGINAAMIDYYGQSNFKPFTDCGLDLGWSHPNASNPPQWPADDCYHTCNTGCKSLAVSPDAGNNTNNGTGSGSGTQSGASASMDMKQSVAALVGALVLGGLAVMI
ncbi:hypothetical protein FRB99_002518 [Tulasnella sp. 403]|nr:hypothetical protein FRB99_002518 [Tulasnella sp. 403]